MNKSLYLSLGLYFFILVSPVSVYPQSCSYYNNGIATLREVRRKFLEEVIVIKKISGNYKAHEDYINSLERRLRDLESKYKNCKNQSSN